MAGYFNTALLMPDWSRFFYWHSKIKFTALFNAYWYRVFILALSVAN
jgi:hypothetical protein